MILPWRRRRSAARGGNKKNELFDGNSIMEVTIPTHFQCPISLDLMKDPVTLSTGITYDRESIEKWIESGNQTCPVTNQILSTFDQIPNHAIRKMIQDWCVQNRSNGIERIPTPRIPVSSYEISEICKKLAFANERRDEKKCSELVSKIKKWGKESERNKRSIVGSAIGCVLSNSFEVFSGISMEKHMDLLMEILSILIWVFQFGEKDQLKIGSLPSLKCLIWVLKNGDLTSRQNSVLALKELVSMDEKHVISMAEIEGIEEGLVKLVKEPICPPATKASLIAIFFMISPSSISGKMISRFVELGLVSLIMEILLEGEKSLCEKALGVLNFICDSEEGRQKAYNHALTIPLLVKKIFRVLDAATEFSITILWKLCKNEKRVDGGVMVEALQVGAFQKILVLLQVGCGQNVKEMVTDLLKLLNLYKGKLDCIDSLMDFKYLKASN